VKSGQVVVEVTPPQYADGRREEYALEAGDTAVGLLFVLASLEADPTESRSDAVLPPEVCRFHGSSGKAGACGAEVLAVPTAAISEAFDLYPAAMQSMVRRLCVRNALVVFNTLSTYFNLRRETLVPSTYENLNIEGAESLVLEPREVFERLLGHRWRSLAKDRRDRIEEVLGSAKSLECEEGEYALPPNQRAGHLLVLLEGELHMERLEKQVEQGKETPLKKPKPPERRPLWGRQASGYASGPHRVNIGEAIGEVSVLIDRPAPIAYQCATRCRFAALPRETAQQLLELCPRTWCLKLLHLLAARTASWLHRVDAALDWLPVEGGQCLYREGDPNAGFFVVLSGRLLALEEREANSRRAGGARAQGMARMSSAGRQQWHVLDVLQRGRLCGELDCLRETPYSHTVRASRDSEVCRVSPTVLHLIAMEFPRAILHFSSLVGPRAGGRRVEARHKVTIAVIPASQDVDIQAVCANLSSALNKLGKTLHISPHSDFGGLPGSVLGAAKVDGTRLGRHLAELEERCRWLVYEGEPPSKNQVTDWTRRCVRQADHILVAVNFDGRCRGDVPEGVNERYIEEAGLLHVDRDLLILHQAATGFTGEGKPETRDDWFALAARAADALKPGVQSFVAHHTQLFLGHRKGRALRSTRHYLNPRPWATRWHHVRVRVPGDWARCSRLLAGRAIGICLGGGGARGNCHFGVIKALHELGIPIDVVSGTSFGALAGGIYSMCAPQPGSMYRVIRTVMGRKFSTRKMLMDFNFPRTAYFTGAYLNSILKDTFARRRCEDLLVPFACPSCDILTFDAKMHREGPLWRIVRASMSLVGFVPPLPYQERRGDDGSVTNSLLVDGGYVDQYPIEVLKDHGAGVVICTVACPDFEPINTDYGDVVHGGWVTLRRFFGCRRRAVADPPSQAEIQERLMFLVENMKEGNESRSDLTLYPDIQGYGLLDFAKYEEIMETGYRTAITRLPEWLAGDSKGARLTREIIEMAKSEEQASPTLNEVEYGGRMQYAKWRNAGLQRATQIVRRFRSRTELRTSGADDRSQSPSPTNLRARIRSHSADCLR